MEKIVKCFNEKDVEGLKSMFCKSVSDTDIQKAFYLLNGEIKDYRIDGHSGGGKTLAYGETIYESGHNAVRNIIIDKKIYIITADYYSVYKEKPDEVGLHCLSVKLLTEDKLNELEVVEIGEWLP